MDEPVRQPFEFIRDYLSATYHLDSEKLTVDRSFDSLGLDSIAQVEMFVTLSDHYGIRLDDAHARGHITLRETADLVQEALDSVDRRNGEP
ncbi:acyl carrier protein [Streptomyces sp. XH2]|uniref:acyl carrier protein n=1 Tax=Streptomyces sp. XH2 TaxID=3412483 RepID=UPI003C7CD566